MKIDNIFKDALNTSALTGNKVTTGDAFSDMVTKAIENTVGNQKKAEALTAAAANGENVPMHEVIQAVSDAEITLQTMVTVRDRAVEAYQEILRMPI